MTVAAPASASDILVVAANDSVKPQNIVDITHAKSADVPIIVAMNKIDLDGADIEKVKGDLTIKYYPTRSCTVNTLSAHIKKATSFGAEVDMILVDYADIMRDVGKSTEMRHQLGNIYEDLRGLAGEMQIPIWTASQANRSALDEDVIEASKVAESYAKVMTADFVMSLSRKIEDKIGDTGRFHVIKNRFGPDGLTYPARVNTNIGKIELFEAKSAQGKEVQSKIRNRDNQTKQMLSARYDDLMSDN